jgi:tetratricopeptide (TPR) repeat protein
MYEDRGDYASAFDDLNRAVSVDPYSAEVFIRRGSFQTEIYNDPQAGFADIEHAIELDPEYARAYSARAYTRLALGNSAGAIDDFKQVIALDPSDNQARYNLASLFGRMGSYSESLATYEALGTEDEYALASLLYRPQIRIALNEFDAALNDVNAYLDVSSRASDFLATGYLVRGLIYLYLEQYDSAARDYQAAFQIYTEFASNYANWGGGYRSTPLRELDIVDVQEQLIAYPETATLYIQLGHLYMEFGRWQEAIDAYHQALRLEANPDLAAFVDAFEDLVGG